MIIRFLSRVMVMGLALTILFVSIARAGLEIMAQGNGDLKKNEISFKIVNKDGENEETIYKLPEIGMLPSNMFYGIKQVRDYLWLSFSSGMHKLEVSLLLADKKTAEAWELLKADKESKAIEAGNEAMDKLEYTNRLIGNTKLSEDQTKLISQQVFLAGYAYRELFGQAESQINIDTQKYFKLISRIDDWNKEQEKNRNSWDY